MTEIRTDLVTRDVIAGAYTYEEYKELIRSLLAKNKTTGENHSEEMLHYTLINFHRMKRLDRQIDVHPALMEELEAIDRDMTWLVLTEAWCGDAAQIVPLFKRMADLNSRISLRFILRDEHPELMEGFLYKGSSRSIPVLIALDSQTLDVIGSWGPRPQEAKDLIEELQGNSDTSYQEAAEKLHKWYTADNTESTQLEFLRIIPAWNHC